MHVQSSCFACPVLFFPGFGLPSTCVRRVKTVIENASSQKRSPVEISENAVLLYSCGWMKHENTSSFENDNVTMLVTSKCACSHHRWYSFQSLGTLRSDDGDGSENVAEEVNSRSFNLHRDYSKSLTLSNVFEASQSWIPKNHIQVQKERGNLVVACVLPLHIVKLGIFMS